MGEPPPLLFCKHGATLTSFGDMCVRCAVGVLGFTCILVRSIQQAVVVVCVVSPYALTSSHTRKRLVSYGDYPRRSLPWKSEQEANFTARCCQRTASGRYTRLCQREEGGGETEREIKGPQCGWSIMASVGDGRGRIEDDLVGAAIQISTLGKENKNVKRELASALSENAR